MPPLRSRLPWFAAFPLILLLLAIPLSAQNPGFPQLAPDELKMTSEPQAPGAPAVILFREADVDDNGTTSHEDHYLRIKVLTEEGRKYANVEIPFIKATEDIVNIRARTVQPDGQTTEFHDQIFEKTIVKLQGLKYLAKTITLPNVQVGSIIEYSYTMDLKEHRVFNSHWILSSDLFTQKARFSLKPYTSRYRNDPVNLRWSWQGLPPDSRPKEGPDHIIRMDAENIPAFQAEDFMPPVDQVKSRVDFTYESEYRESDPDEYWQHVAKSSNAVVESFIDKRKAVDAALATIISPSDPPETKLRKIYGRVQQIRNTSYERRKTAQEEKRDKVKIDENVEDVLKGGYGSHRQLTWLFLALVRAAGFEAYPVLVSSRNDYFFFPKTMERWKLNSAVVLVKLDGKDLFLDPGAEFNSYGMLTWSETGVDGLRLDKDGGSWVVTTQPDSSASLVQRSAKLKLNDNGDLEGKVTITYTGLEAMYHRLDVRNADDVTRAKFLEDRIRSQIPIASEVHLTSQPDWSGSETPLTANFDVKIPSWTSNAGKRTVMPIGFFTAGEKHVFEHTSRTYPIYHHYAYEKQDDVTIELPEGLQANSVPPPQSRDGHVMQYSSTVENNKTTLHIVRRFSVKFVLLDAKYYPSLRDFYQFVRSADDQQILLEPAAVAAK
jgi:hypothetical protein